MGGSLHSSSTEQIRRWMERMTEVKLLLSFDQASHQGKLRDCSKIMNSLSFIDPSNLFQQKANFRGSKARYWLLATLETGQGPNEAKCMEALVTLQILVLQMDKCRKLKTPLFGYAEWCCGEAKIHWRQECLPNSLEWGEWCLDRKFCGLHARGQTGSSNVYHTCATE